MTVTIRLPTVLRKLAGDQAEVPIDAATVAAALASLADQYPDLGQQLLDGQGKLRSFVRVFIDQVDLEERGGVDAPVDDGTVVRIIPAIAGG